MQSSVIDTPIKYQHRRKLDFLDVDGISEAPVQDGRSRQLKNWLESQSSSQSSEYVNHGTQPDAKAQRFEDYDWDEDRMVKYRRNDNGGFDRIWILWFLLVSEMNQL